MSTFSSSCLLPKQRRPLACWSHSALRLGVPIQSTSVLFPQILYMCGGLLERPLILTEVVPRYSVMLNMLNTELDNAKILYDAQVEASAAGNIPPIHKNMPPMAGQLKWSLEMQERLEAPMRDIKVIDHP